MCVKSRVFRLSVVITASFSCNGCQRKYYPFEQCFQTPKDFKITRDLRYLQADAFQDVITVHTKPISTVLRYI